MALGNTLTTGPDSQTILGLAWAETAGTWGKTGGVATCSALSGSIGFATITSTVSDVLIDMICPTYTAGSVGIVARYQDASNYLIAYYNGTNARLDKVVAGTTTNLISGAVTYGATKVLRLILDGTAARLYYNNVLVNTGTAPSSTYKLHGLYTTNTGNTFDDFTLFPRSGFTDAPFEELTVTRDTGTKYAGTASAKLVAGGADATFLQSLNVGDTATYTLIAYAYTTGAAVTTADLNLYYDTAVISTTFTDMGSGWYKLTGTLTGVASAKNYGVKVKAGKTVYVDTLSLQAVSGATIEVTFENSSSGTSNYTFENNLVANGVTTVNGSKNAVVSKSGNYTLTSLDNTVIFTASATASLPPATGSGQTYRIVCRAGTVTIDASGSETVVGELTQTLTAGENLIISDVESGKWE